MPPKALFWYFLEETSFPGGRAFPEGEESLCLLYRQQKKEDCPQGQQKKGCVKMKKRSALILAGLMAMGMVLSVCGEEQEAPAGEAVQVTEEAEGAETDYVIELDPQYNVPTEELLELFPITYQTPAETELSQKIQNRMLNGFNRWNMGYEAWEHWGEVLYHADSIYNVNAVRMTLAEYQMAMDISLKKLDIQMGDFTNMILVDDWMAIQYDIVNIDRETGVGEPGTTMEFARFGDYGELGAKVDEGWGGSKNESYSGMLHFLTEEELAAQNAFMEEVAQTVLPETDNLEEKYPVVYPTTIDTDLGLKMKEAILQDFEAWNSGYDAWCAWADTFYTEDAVYAYRTTEYDVAGVKEVMKDLIESSQRVRINNILVSEDWAAIHFWNSVTDAEGNKDAENHMQFLHFVENEDGSVQVDLCFAK